MCRAKDVGQHWTTFNAIKSLCAQNGKMNASLAGSQKLGWKVSVST